MPDNIVNTRIKLASKSASDWSTANPTLLDGEVGLDTTNKLIYVGDGSTPFDSLDPWNELPTLATVATSGLYSDLSGTPSLATVATSGSYADLSNKPMEIPTISAGDAGKVLAVNSNEDGVEWSDEDIYRFSPSLVGGWSTDGMPSIVANDNLNQAKFCKIGRYGKVTTAIAATLTNCPFDMEFSFEVEAYTQDTVDDESGTYRYRLRRIKTYNGFEFIQYCSTSGTAGSWTFYDWMSTNWMVSTVRRPTSLDFPHSVTADRVSVRLDQSSSSLTGGVNSVFGEGYVMTFMWDTNAKWDTQFYVPDADGKAPAYRCFSPSQNAWGSVKRFCTTEVTKTNITSLTNGATILSGYGGCYYEVCNNLLHLHIACGGLTANTEKNIYTMPSGYRPSDRPTNIGIGGDFSSMASVSRLRVMSNGNVTVNSTDTNAIADLWYYI